MNELLNISPIDGRYKNKTKELENYFSEYALIKYRLFIEISWLKFITNENIIEYIVYSLILLEIFLAAAAGNINNAFIKKVYIFNSI